MNSIMNNKEYWSRLSDIQKAIFNQLSLSREQLTIVSEYYRLTTEHHLSASDAYQLGSLWRQAEDDKQLTRALMLIDELKPLCLEDQELISENQDLRTYLSEHIPVLAEEKLKQFKGTLEELDVEKSYVMVLCPDGSGITHINIENGTFVSLDKLDQQICEQCDQPFSAHEKYIYFEGKSPQTAAKKT